MKAIEVRGVSKTYGKKQVLTNIDLDIFQGEVFGIIGPNGAGKTTLMEMLMGVRKVSAGEISVLGLKVPAQQPALRTNIGVLFQETALSRKMRVGEVLDFFESLYPVSQREFVIETFQLGDTLRKPVKSLSGGWKQRVLLAIALLHKPKVLFLDEPTTGLDPEARAYLWDALQMCKAEGLTTLVSTHHMDEVYKYCQRVAVINQGRIVALDTPKRLLNSMDSDAATFEDVYLAYATQRGCDVNYASTNNN